MQYLNNLTVKDGVNMITRAWWTRMICLTLQEVIQWCYF